MKQACREVQLKITEVPQITEACSVTLTLLNSPLLLASKISQVLPTSFMAAFAPLGGSHLLLFLKFYMKTEVSRILNPVFLSQFEAQVWVLLPSEHLIQS